MERVPARPGIVRRLGAALALVTIVTVIGAGIAIGLLAGAAVIGRVLESAVQ